MATTAFCDSYFSILVYFAIVDDDGGVSWVVVEGVWYLSLVSSYVSTLGGGAVWYFTLVILELRFLEGMGGWVEHPCLRVELVHQNI